MNSDFNFSLTGWFRNSLQKVWTTKNNISFIWIRIKVSGSKKPVLLNIFEDKIPIEKIRKFQIGDLVKISGYIQFTGNVNKYYLVPTEIELIASNNVSLEDFKKLNTLVEKEQVLERQKKKIDDDNNEFDIDDEIVEIVW